MKSKATLKNEAKELIKTQNGNIVEFGSELWCKTIEFLLAPKEKKQAHRCNECKTIIPYKSRYCGNCGRYIPAGEHYIGG